MSYCNLPDKTVGPYNQTMFLGCSVTNFNCNLGWGADQSTLTVSLTNDYCYHPQSNEYGSVDTILDTLEQQPDNIQGGTAFHKKEDGSGDYNYVDPTKALHKNIGMELNNAEKSRDAENIKLPANIKDYGKVCYDHENTKYDYTEPDPGFLGFGNKFSPFGYDILGVPVVFKFNNFSFGGLLSSWKQNGSQGGIAQYEVEIKSFSNLLNGTQLIIGNYAGTMCGILPGTNGTDSFGNINYTQKNLAMPVPYVADLSTPIPSFSFNDFRASIEQGNIPNAINIYGYIEYKGLENKIYGNARVNENGMKAVFIYDAINFLIGIPAAYLPQSYNAFSPYGGLVSRTITENTTVRHLDPIQERIQDSSENVNLTHMGVCPVSKDPLLNSEFRKSRFLFDLSEVPRPPAWYRIQGPVISLMQFITEICDGFGFDFFVDFIPANGFIWSKGYSGIIKIRTISRRTHPKKDNIARLIDYLSTTEVQKTQAQIQSEILSANAVKNQLITSINALQLELDQLHTTDGKLGYLSEEWRDKGAKAYQEALDDGSTTEVALQRLQSEYQQGASITQQKNQLSSQISQLESQLDNNQTNINRLITTGAGVISYNYGKEFTDSNTRSMYIGGKQKRLLQVKNIRLAYKQNTLIYNPFANNGDGALIDYDNIFQPGSIPNSIRVPNVFSTRRKTFRIFGGSAVISSSLDFDSVSYFPVATESLSLKKGNYFPSVRVTNSQEAFVGSVGNIGKNVALMEDYICPYFGEGANGLIRQVYFDKNMGQMQIIFNIMDIQNLTSLSLTNYNPYPVAGQATGTTSVSPVFLVLENEIRAAGGGFGSWLNYCFNNVFTTDIAEIIYKGFRDKYGFGAKRDPGPDGRGQAAMFVNLKNTFISGMSQIIGIAMNKNVDFQGRPVKVNLDVLHPTIRTLYLDLKQIHKFFETIANEYYGKQYMIKVPEIAYYRDYEYAVDNNNRLIQTGIDDLGYPIYAIEGTGKVYTNYQISTDGAWEEYGNTIDDTLTIGGVRASFFADETGKIPPILGFNSTIEKDYSRRWKRRIYLARIYDLCRGASVWDVDRINLAAMKSLLTDPDLNELNHYYFSLSHELNPEEHMVMKYNANILNIPMAHGEISPANGFNQYDNSLGRHKLYVKGSTSEEVKFLGINNTNPRAVVSISSPVFIGSDRNKTDRVCSMCIVQDSLLRIINGSSVPQIMKAVGRIKQLGGEITVFDGLGDNWWLDNRFFKIDGGSTSTLNIIRRNLAYRIAMEATSSNLDGTQGTVSEEEIDMLGKAAIPMFCALPVEYNDFIYGPWINHPGLIKNIIFPDTNSLDIMSNEIENLIGGVKIQVDESLVPWNYGGMDALDAAVMHRITDDVNYQQTIETGTIQVPTFDNFNLGDMLKFYSGLFNGPVLNSIQVQIGSGGITTTYNFRTYIKKLGLFNKENADRIKAINQESLKRNKELTNKLMTLISKLGNGPGAIRIF